MKRFEKKRSNFMKTILLKWGNGRKLALPLSDNAEPLCPICGCVLNECPYSDFKDGDPPIPSYDTCLCCRTQYGCDDMSGLEAPNGALEKIWAKIRLRWLDKVNWDPKALVQLKNIEINIDELKRKAGKK